MDGDSAATIALAPAGTVRSHPSSQEQPLLECQIYQLAPVTSFGSGASSVSSPIMISTISFVNRFRSLLSSGWSRWHPSLDLALGQLKKIDDLGRDWLAFENAAVADFSP